MKVNPCFLLALVLSMTNFICHSQEQSFEEEALSCIYQSFEDDGKALRLLIYEHELFLIEEGFLNGNSGDDYYEQLYRMSIGELSGEYPSIFFFKEYHKLVKKDITSLKNCIWESEAFHNLPDNHKFILFGSALMKFSKIQSSKEMLKILSPKDLESNLYKMGFFLLFSTIETDAGLDRINKPVVHATSENYDPTIALSLHLKKEGFFVNKKKVTNQELKDKIRNYFLANKSKSQFVIGSEKDFSYKNFDVFNKIFMSQIDTVRNNYSLEKFQLSLEDLTQEQLKQVDSVYPINIFEEETYTDFSF